MATMTDAFRVCKQAEVRTLADGRPIVDLLLAYSYGKRQEVGGRPTQFVNAAWFGESAADLAKHLGPGVIAQITIRDVHVAQYSIDPPVFRLEGIVVDLSILRGLRTEVEEVAA